MWRSPSSLFFFRALVPGAAVNLTPRLTAEHRIRHWAHHLFSSTTFTPTSGAPDSSSSLDSMSFNEAKRLMRLVNVEALKRKLGMKDEEAIGYNELLEACKGMGVARTKEEAVAFAKVLVDAGVVSLFRDKVYLHPNKHNDQADNQNPQLPLPKRGIGAKLSAADKRKFLINTLLDLKDSKESVYGTLDAWVAWEHNFPLPSLKQALLVLQKEEQWHRVVQVIKWMLSKGQGTTMGTYEQLIRALEKDNRAEEAHRMWAKKISHDLHSVPWRFCELMVSIYYRNNMLDRLVKLFKGLESYDRRPPNKLIVQRVADAYEMLDLLEEKNRVLEKYSDLFSDSLNERFKKSRKGWRKNDKKPGKNKNIGKEAKENVEVDSGPSDAQFADID